MLRGLVQLVQRFMLLHQSEAGMEPTGVAERTKLRAAPPGSFRAALVPASAHTFRGDDSHRACETRGDRQLS